jgi:RNA polymerase sigma-70 factor, ECF subfamily
MVDEASFDSLTTPHIPTMVRIAAVLVGQAYAEDAVQEALLRAWQARETLRTSSAIRPWLLRITVNLCHDWQRGRFGLEGKMTEPLDVATNIARLASFANDPGSTNHAAFLDLRREIDRLPDEYRLIIVLRYYVGLDASEIGAALQLPSPTVRTRLRRGLDRLRQQLDKPFSVMEGTR